MNELGVYGLSTRTRGGVLVPSITKGNPHIQIREKE
jgi:hypothetical protein